MDKAAYANLAAVERAHWYYVGKRELVREWLRRSRALSSDLVVLDCGAGTGLFAEEIGRECRVLVLDDHEEALEMLRQRFAPEQVIGLKADGVPLPDSSVDAITALDVLEHTPDDAAVVREFQRLLKPGGVALATVPASMALWSEWDKILHHYRRYSRRSLLQQFDPAQWNIEYVNYTNVPVFPLVWAIRKCRNFFPGSGASKTEDQVPPAWINRLLKWQFVRLAFSSIPFPFGVSLIVIARKR